MLKVELHLPVGLLLRFVGIPLSLLDQQHHVICDLLPSMFRSYYQVAKSSFFSLSDLPVLVRLRVAELLHGQT